MPGKSLQAHSVSDYSSERVSADARMAWCGQTRLLVHRTIYPRRYSSLRAVVDCTAGNVTGGLSASFSMRCLSVCPSLVAPVELKCTFVFHGLLCSHPNWLQCNTHLAHPSIRFVCLSITHRLLTQKRRGTGNQDQREFSPGQE